MVLPWRSWGRHTYRVNRDTLALPSLEWAPRRMISGWRCATLIYLPWNFCGYAGSPSPV